MTLDQLARTLILAASFLTLVIALGAVIVVVAGVDQSEGRETVVPKSVTYRLAPCSPHRTCRVEA